MKWGCHPRSSLSGGGRTGGRKGGRKREGGVQ